MVEVQNCYEIFLTDWFLLQVHMSLTCIIVKSFLQPLSAFCVKKILSAYVSSTGNWEEH